MQVENDIEQIGQLMDQLHQRHHHLTAIQFKKKTNSYQVLVELQKELYLFSYHEYENE
jgi:hypothetical protein